MKTNNLTQMGVQNCCSKTEEKDLEIKGGQLTKELLNKEKEKNLNDSKEIKMEGNKVGLETSNQFSDKEINIKEIQPQKEENPDKNEIKVKSLNENLNTNESYEKYENILDSEYLFLNCPKCQKIPCLSFSRDNLGIIIINCDHCRYSSTLYITDYINGLSNKNLLGKSKCLKHNNFLDKFCFKCHQEYCTKCETKYIHSDHAVISIRKIFNPKQIKDAKTKIDDYKKEFENYINSFLKENMNKYPNNQDFIKNDLIEPYITVMKAFFKIAENILLNYDIEYPNYYQQLNLKTFLNFLDEQISFKILDKIKENLLIEDNNFNNEIIDKNEKKENNKKLKDLLENLKDEEIKTILICDDKLIIALKKYLKVYNYKSGNCIATIENLYEPECNFSLYQIFENLFSIILYKSDDQSIIKIFSINSNNKILFERSFNYKIKNIKKLNDYSFGLLSNGSNDIIEIYKSSENFKEISDSLSLKENYSLNLEIISKIELSSWIRDFAYMPNQSYLVVLTYFEIIVFNQEFKIHKKIKHKNISLFNSINQLNDGNLILGGIYIGMLNKKNLAFTVVHEDILPEKKTSYLAETETDIDFSQFNLASSNKLICKKYFKQNFYYSYEDMDDEIHKENIVCIFDYNPETCKIKLIKTLHDLNFKDIFSNKKGEIILTNDDNIEYL